MRRPWKALTALAVVLCALLGLFPVEALAREAAIEWEYPAEYASPENTGQDLVPPEGFREYLIEQFKTCPNSVNISAFQISANQKTALNEYIWYEVPELFQIYGLGSSTNGTYITSVYANYSLTQEEYAQMLPEMLAAADTLLAGIEGNSRLSDVEKALLLHDRLGVWVEYDIANLNLDTIPRKAYTAYGALADGVAVCQGYAMAYMYLLSRVGIESDYCSSDTMNHGWNIVYINGIPYHVDVTHDDSGYKDGDIGHQNFLVSTDTYKSTSTQHNKSDFNSSPVDTRYENYCWKDSNTAFTLLNGEIYYIDNSSQTLNRYEGGSGISLKSVSYRWNAVGGGYWRGNYARLSTDGQTLLYSLGDGVYAYDPVKGTSQKVFAPSTLTSTYLIYGFTYKQGYLVCNLADSANCVNLNLVNYKLYDTVTQLYDPQKPTGAIACTDAVADSQTVTLTLRDNAAVDGYYWGTAADYTACTYNRTDGETVALTVSQPGTYYLTVKDRAGNLSETTSLTLHKTTLNAQGGTVGLPSVLTPAGKSAALPTPVREGYSFLGWSANAQAAAGVTELTPTASATYYALWQKNAPTLTGIRITAMPTKTAYLVGESLDVTGLELTLDYDSGSQKTYDGFTVEGFDSAAPGECTVTVRFGDFVDQFKVLVEKKGDLDGNDRVTDRDAIYLLFHIMISGSYKVTQSCDFNGDGRVSDADALYLLYHSMMPGRYPLN